MGRAYRDPSPEARIQAKAVKKPDSDLPDAT
jgi:hypothetical protein